MKSKNTKPAGDWGTADSRMPTGYSALPQAVGAGIRNTYGPFIVSIRVHCNANGTREHCNHNENTLENPANFIPEGSIGGKERNGGKYGET